MTRSRTSDFACGVPPEETGTHAGQCCAWEGCTGAGEYRAPKDRTLVDYVFFCLDHIRAYNARWDFHAGFSTKQLEDEIRSAATWERPTWKLGTLGSGMRGARVKDPFGFSDGTMFEDGARKRAEDARERAQAKGTPGGAAARTRALKVLDLSGPLTLESLKQRYKDLVKRHHPDANGGSAEAEKRMKIINEAYQTLRAGLVAAG